MTFIEWSKRYKSDIVGFRVWPGIVNVVVCNTFASIREVLAGKEADALSGRVKSQLATLHNPEGLGAPTFLTHLLSGGRARATRRHSDACDYVRCTRTRMCTASGSVLVRYRRDGRRVVAHSPPVRHASHSPVARDSCISNRVGATGGMHTVYRRAGARRFAKQVLHELGLGRSVLEDSIRLRLNEMLDKIEEESRPAEGSGERRPVDPEQRLMRAVSDVVCALFFGKPMSNDPMFEAVYYTFMECLQWKYRQPEYVKHFAKCAPSPQCSLFTVHAVPFAVQLKLQCS